jgi:hypothetical protein
MAIENWGEQLKGEGYENTSNNESIQNQQFEGSCVMWSLYIKQMLKDTMHDVQGEKMLNKPIRLQLRK